ncbi:hypothetical protein D3C86_1563640 [compost metagenome]
MNPSSSAVVMASSLLYCFCSAILRLRTARVLPSALDSICICACKRISWFSSRLRALASSSTASLAISSSRISFLRAAISAWVLAICSCWPPDRLASWRWSAASWASRRAVSVISAFLALIETWPIALARPCSVRSRERLAAWLMVASFRLE